jgi:tripartite-type tricarboxylate transporter receptor subunit TctC
VLPGFDAGVWMGLFAPGATSTALVTRLQEETARILQEPDVRRMLASQGGEIVASTPSQFASFMQVEVRKWAEMVRISGAKAE